MKNRKIRKALSRNKKPRCIVKFKFRRNKFDVGTHYAAVVNGEKIIGVFGRRSRVKTNTVTLFIPTEHGKAMKQIHVPKAAIIHDPWAAVQNIPREEPPKCVLFKKPTMCARRYGGQGAQHKPKGLVIRTKAKASQI